jgi:hypothetical protein
MTTPAETGLTADFAVSLQASVDGLAAALSKEQRDRQRRIGVIRQVPFSGAINIAGGIGVYDQPDQLQAKTGYIWDVRRLTVQGFSAGVVTAYRNGVMNPVTGLNPGEPFFPFPVPAVETFGKAEAMLMAGDRICFGAAGITAATGQVLFWGVASCFEEWYLPYYLG